MFFFHAFSSRNCRFEEVPCSPKVEHSLQTAQQELQKTVAPRLRDMKASEPSGLCKFRAPTGVSSGKPRDFNRFHGISKSFHVISRGFAPVGVFLDPLLRPISAAHAAPAVAKPLKR